MKVLILTSSYPIREGTHEGGFVADLVRKLPERGIVPVVLAPHFPGGPFKEFQDGTAILRFPYFFPSRFERLAYGAGLLINIRRDLFAFAGIIPFCISEFFWTLALVYREKVDIIHTHWLIPQGFIGTLVHQINGIPFIATVHGTDLAVIIKSAVLTRICSFIIRNSDAVTVNSSYTRQQLLSIIPESEGKIHVIPMGVDLEAFSPNLPLPLKKSVPSGHGILNVGRLIALKGTQYLIKAMPHVIHKYPDAVLVIIGSGPQEDHLTRMVRELSLDEHVRFMGNIPHNELHPYYQAADVFVLPSILFNGTTEGLGVVLLEAMAAGCPVIGSNVGGIPDIIIDGETGFLVPEQRPDILAEKIVKIFSDTDIKEKFRRFGLMRVQEKFSWDVISEQFTSVYAQVYPCDFSKDSENHP